MVYRIVAPRIHDFQCIEIEIADASVGWGLNRIAQSEVHREFVSDPDIILNERRKVPKASGPCAMCGILIFGARNTQQNVGESISAAASGEIGRVLPIE